MASSAGDRKYYGCSCLQWYLLHGECASQGSPGGQAHQSRPLTLLVSLLPSGHRLSHLCLVWKPLVDSLVFSYRSISLHYHSYYFLPPPQICLSHLTPETESIQIACTSKCKIETVKLLDKNIEHFSDPVAGHNFLN